VDVIDGDTIEIETGERVRYLMVDTPELSSSDCYAQEALAFNTELVADREVTLRYDVECEDRFERTLAYVSVDGREVNSLLVEEGYACVLFIPPNGEDRRDEFDTLERQAQLASSGMWAACEEVACEN
jgi:micrococcal nuclease